MQGPFHLHGLGKADRAGGVKDSFPVSNHQLLGYVGAILVRMTASWTGFLILALVTEGFLTSYLPHFLGW